MDRRGAIALLGTLGSSAFLASNGQAAVARALRLSDLVGRSRFALLATTLARHCHWATVGDSRRIVTTTRARVEELVTGEDPGTTEVMFRTLGGTVGKIGQIVEGEADFVVGERALVFARPVAAEVFGVTGMAQGHYPVSLEATGGVLRPSRSLPRLVGQSGAAVERLNGLTVADALRLVRAERP
jgi:hypothetical protein